jgi:hypothetical protein
MAADVFPKAVGPHMTMTLGRIVSDSIEYALFNPLKQLQSIGFSTVSQGKSILICNQINPCEII